MAEFFDLGWESLRLQTKIAFQKMSSLNWKDPVPDDLNDAWIEYFVALESARGLQIPRSVIPDTASPKWKIRLICLSDTAEGAGGTAIYGGIELTDLSHLTSCWPTVV
jgi:Pao retrotransposon peptidase